jgi:hypothetical protein
VFEDNKGVIRIRKSSKNRQHNGQKKNNKQRSTRHTHKTKVPTKSEVEQNKNPELQLDQHVTAWTASWVNVNDWAHFDGHYLFLHEDKYYMRNKINKITQKRQ